jgi:probable HAF family extracellular repeat protein
MQIVKSVLTGVVALVLPAALAFAVDGANDPAGIPEAVPAIYVADFVSTAAFGVAMNDAGDVTGSSYTDPGCGPFCLPPLETVVWKRGPSMGLRSGQRIVLPPVPGLTGITVRGINSQGWVAGFAGFPPTVATHAVVWKWNGHSYTGIDLGVLPGTTTSEAIGIDNLGRVVGWSTTLNFPPNGSPFMWSEATGMVDLAAQGFPDDIPLAISPGGAVSTPGYWYKLGDPASVVPMPSPPQGFFPPGTYPTAINDSGDQARFLVTTSSQNPAYLFRFHQQGTWQQISFTPNFGSTPYGIGSINAAGDVTATVQGDAQIAGGPDGLTQPLAPLLSPAYNSLGIAAGGPIDASGQILAQVFIGNSRRLMRLTPGSFCTSNCIRVSSLQMTGEFVQDPADPGHCSPGNNAYNRVSATAMVTDEAGVPLSGVLVRGRLLDDYWTNRPVSATTDAEGRVYFKSRGPCGVGAVAFLVDSAQRGSQTLDRTSGILSSSVIPH